MLGGNVVTVRGIDNTATMTCSWGFHLTNISSPARLLPAPAQGIECDVPSAAEEQEVILELIEKGGSTFHTFLYHYYQVPDVLACVPSQGRSGNFQTITVFGNRFSNSPDLACHIGGMAEATFVSSTMIICHVTLKQEGRLPVEVSVNGADLSSNGDSATFLSLARSAVVLSSIFPNHGPAPVSYTHLTLPTILLV